MENTRQHDELVSGFKRRRTDSGYEGASQSSHVSSPSLQRQDTQTSSGRRACSPILVSDDLETEVVITEENKSKLLGPFITVFLGSEKQRIPQAKFLLHVWKDGLDSPCMVCHRHFEDDEPPIRTFTFEKSDQTATETLDITLVPIAPHPIRVNNRHLACIKRKGTAYIPVSHVWHRAVSEAQMERIPTPEATRLAYQIPIQTLLAVTKKFGITEIWHDYLSVPQWQSATQQKLLLQIPAIYTYPLRMIMHLDDVQSSQVENIVNPISHTTFVEALCKLTNSHWFERMWVTLEYIQSKEVTILTQYYDLPDATAFSVSQVANLHLQKYIKRLGSDRFNRIATAKGFQWQRRSSWYDMEAWKTLDPRYRTMGAAISIIGQKKCRDPHDHFFAIRALLGFGQDDQEVKTILSEDVFESFLDLAWDALRNGDFSPLLFIRNDNDPRDSRAPWLCGHQDIANGPWDLGTCRRVASDRTIIQGNSINPKLESIGTIQMFEFYDFIGSSETVFGHVCWMITRVQGLATGIFCEAIDRVFPRASHKGMLIPSEATDTPWSGPEVYDEDEIGRLLERHGFFSIKGTVQSEILSVSKKLVGLLGLGLPEDLSRVSRIKAAMNDAEFFGKRREGLASVKCENCLNKFVYRITAWEDLNTCQPKLYRIPGLVYDDTLPEGVGIAVADGKIVGRLSYATPACGCHISTTINLGERSTIIKEPRGG